MREMQQLLTGWQFCRADGDYAVLQLDTAGWEAVTLPHTWNAADGQDGGDDYYRGRCWYRLELNMDAIEPGYEYWLQFDGVSQTADVYCNGRCLGRHKGGFSAFRFLLGRYLRKGRNVIAVCADNSADGPVWPQKADFTVFGGIYRPASLLKLPMDHFSTEKAGSDGLFVSTRMDGTARVDVFSNNDRSGITVTVKDAEGKVCASEQVWPKKGQASVNLHVQDVHRWDGVRDPYLYTCEAVMESGDAVSAQFGFRNYAVDPRRGFYLNGEEYPLHGVALHQDCGAGGWAVTPAQQAADIALVREMGANAVRLAHYQHSRSMIDLCNRAGLVVWAEIPLIAAFDAAPAAQENLRQQLVELIAQNYNDPAIFFWGLGNEPSAAGESPELEECLRMLHRTAKALNPTRLTTLANTGMTPLHSGLNFITDVVAYDHFFGWYTGKTGDLAPWLDTCHGYNGQRPLGLGAYGADAVTSWHSETPHALDYTEEYQAQYHEQTLEILAARPWLWGTFVWSMFDFAADARAEGGAPGRNNKGLICFDHKTKKDAFYVYKAWWSDKAFVHIASRRFTDRVCTGKTQVRVYSNRPAVTLTVNGGAPQRCEGAHVFVFEVQLQPGENTICAEAESGTDSITLTGVAEPNPAYTMPRAAQPLRANATNWYAALGSTKKSR